jgi:hypothetical protein
MPTLRCLASFFARATGGQVVQERSNTPDTPTTVFSLHLEGCVSSQCRPLLRGAGPHHAEFQNALAARGLAPTRTARCTDDGDHWALSLLGHPTEQ